MHKPIRHRTNKKKALEEASLESQFDLLVKKSPDLTDLNETQPPRPEVTISLEYCSPETAHGWHSEHNRKLIPNHAAAIERDMEAGRFHFTGVPLLFAKGKNEEDDLIDGDHRRVGVINSRRGQWFVVVRGLDKVVQEYVDLNTRPRHVRDLLSLHQPPIEPSQLIAAAGGYFAVRDFHGWFQGYSPATKLTPDQIYQTILATPRLQELANQYSRRREPGSLPASILIAIHTVLDAADSEEAKEFMHQLYTGDGLQINSAIWSMRRWISRHQHRKGSQYLRWAGDAVCWLWNQQRLGERGIRIHVPKEPFKII